MTELETPYTATAEKAAKTAVTRFYGARGADAFQEVEVALKGDLVALDGTHGIDLAPGDAAALGYRLIQLAKKAGWNDPLENDWK